MNARQTQTIATRCASGSAGQALFAEHTVSDVQALTIAEPLPQQTWHCKTTRQTVLMVHGQDRYSWDF